jgi:Zn-dependent protease
VSPEAVSFTTPELIRNCRRCSRELTPGALVCEYCHALVYSEQLDRLAAEARALEAKGDLRQAREQWLMGLPLLPPTSKQAQWIEDHARSLEAAADPNQYQPMRTTAALQARQTVGQRGILSLGALLSFVAFVAIYSTASGWQFGIGFATLILIHEMGHYVDIRRRGLPADMPIFLPGLGAYVRWRALGVSLETRAAISLAGPLAGFLAAVACAAFFWQTRDPFWLVLARVGAALNLLNLIPVWILDGGQAALALSKTQRIIVLAASLVLWLVLRENVLLLVAAGTFYRAFFSADLPARPSPATTIYFVAVVTALSVILRVLPGKGFSIP